MKKTWLAFVAACALSALPSYGSAEQAVPPATVDRVIVTPGSKSEDRTAYENAVVALALKKSKPRYGDYSLTLQDVAYSRTRTTRLLTEGEEVNVITSTPLSLDPALAPGALITIKIPLLQGMLGKRQLIVRRDRVAEFDVIDNLAQLRLLRAGLGFDWSDSVFFDHNKLPYNTGTSVQQLFTMLQRKRFDYFPLGLVEASSALASSGLAGELAIVEDLIIEYPLPVYIQVSATKPRLAARLEYGLKQAQSDGSLEQLFNYHYGDLAARSKNARVIALRDLPAHL